jgi:hypothetical protein
MESGFADRPAMPAAPRPRKFKTARQAKTEAAPIRYVAEMLGMATDRERAIRLIALMVLCAPAHPYHQLGRCHGFRAGLSGDLGRRPSSKY